MEYKIVDTTLRDGEQKSGIAFNVKEKIEIARKLDALGIYQIEAGTPAMGGKEKESIKQIMKLGLKSKISAWNRLKLSDIEHSMDCGVHIVHLCVPSSDMHLNKKLNKDRNWAVENLRKCICFAKSSGFQVTAGFEDASRADFDFLLKLIHICIEENVSRVRFADTLGILTPGKTYEAISYLTESTHIDMEIHAHNDFGMAVANSAAAVKAGAKYVNCTLNGIGERAGNCDYYKFEKLKDLLCVK